MKVVHGYRLNFLIKSTSAEGKKNSDRAAHHVSSASLSSQILLTSASSVTQSLLKRNFGASALRSSEECEAFARAIVQLNSAEP